MFKRILLLFICASILLVYPAYSAPAPAVWSFHRGYLEKSGASLLHTLEVNLPRCSIGNICERNAPFSIYIASADFQNAGAYSFFADNADVTTLFYYDPEEALFKVKPHYEQAFFSNFTSAIGTFKYRSAEGYLKEVAILVADKKIKGRVRFAEGGTPPNLAGLKAVLSHAGSDTVPPHTITAFIDENGEYEVGPLAFFDYDISLGLPVSSTTANIAEDPRTLAITHIVQKFDLLFTVEEPAPGFQLVAPAQLNPALAGEIKSFEQLKGAPVYSRITRDRVALLFTNSEAGEPYVFLGATQSGAVFMLLAPPMKSSSYSYAYFSLFSKEGVYANMEMTGGAIVPALKDPPLSIRLESPIKMGGSAVKAHLYNSEGRAEDITRLFTFNEESETLTANKGYGAALFEKLRRGAGTLSATFCAEDESDLCFRIKREILPAGGVLRVKTALRPKKEKCFFVTLSRLNFSETEYSRVLPLDNRGEVLFEDLPEGEYQLLLSDLELTYYGEAFTSVTREGVLSSREKTLELTLHKANKYTDYKLSDSVRGLGTLHLRREEYKAVNLKSFNIGNIEEFRVLGQPPAGFEYRLSEDSLTLLAPHFAKDVRFALLFYAQGEAGKDGVIYKLNILYEGYNRPQIIRAGQDFSMCPRERSYCEDAFVDIHGLKNGFYNGRFPLTLTFPKSLKGEEIRVNIENKEITEMFDLFPALGKLSLKRSAIPAFLSLLAEGHTLKIEFENALYYLNITAAYKSAELSVVDDLGGRSALFAGLKVALLGSYGGGKIFKTAVIKGERVAFEELPDGEYRAVLVDGKGNYAGETEFSLSAGQSHARLVFRVSCVGGADDYMERCVPLIPIIARGKLKAPEVGLVFIDGGRADFSSVEVTPESFLKARLLGRTLVLFAEEAGEAKGYRVTLKGIRRRVLAFEVEDAGAEYVRASAAPKGGAGELKVLGVDASFVYNGRTPLVFQFNTPYLYDKDELHIMHTEANGTRDVTGMFIWDKHSLTLKEEELQSFMGLLGGRRNLFSIYMAEGDEARGYIFSVVLGGAAADVTAELTGVPVKSAQALLMGKSEKNGYEYRQLVSVKGRTAAFKDVPQGIYEAVVFNLAEGVLGSTELSVSGRESDLYLEIEVKQAGILPKK